MTVNQPALYSFYSNNEYARGQQEGAPPNTEKLARGIEVARNRAVAYRPLGEPGFRGNQAVAFRRVKSAAGVVRFAQTSLQ